MIAATDTWSQTKLDFVGRAHVAKQCVASVTTYHASFLRPETGLEKKMQGVCRSFVARSSIPGDAAPIRGRYAGMQPRELIAALPWKLGGANLVYLPSVFPALAAKNIVRVFGPHRHSMKTLMLRTLADADSATGTASWVITMPHTPHLLANLPLRLQDYVRGLIETRPHRIIAPDAQDFYSVMSEPLAYNHQIRDRADPSSERFCPLGLGTTQGRSWRYLRDIRTACTQTNAMDPTVQSDRSSCCLLLG